MESIFAGNATGVFLGIAGGALVSEDGATVAAAALAAAHAVDPGLAFAGAVLGLWVGDLGVYALARHAAGSSHRWILRWTEGRRPGGPTAGALALSRFVPGTRLPSYIEAGLGRMPLARFAGVTALSALLWAGLLFLLIGLAPAGSGVLASALSRAGTAGLGLFLLLSAWRVFGQEIRSGLRRARVRVARWEFWPAWIFYAPVAGFCAWLGVRYGGFSLPSAANLGQKNGGLVGESKAEILEELAATSPELTAAAWLIPSGPIEERLERVRRVAEPIGLPFVLKPDVAQRGAGFRIVRSLADARHYLLQVKVPVVLQEYVPGPHEAGVFYYRFPGERKGRLLGITRKVFPTVTGDGVHTLSDLIHRDPRASLIAGTYLRRFGAEADRVLGHGERFRLVEAGNHCQGCEFQNGADLTSEALCEAIDGVTRKLAGFHVGRFDVRYADEAEFRRGRGFRIIELNGAAAEATHIYDARNSLGSAYRTLYRQWKVVYAIGAANRRLGHRPARALAIWRDWRAFAGSSCDFPVAD